MDNFNLKKYLAEGTIHQDISENKKYKQGYDDREDESLGARKGAEKDKKQDFAARRGESYGKFGKRDAEAKGKAKGPGKNKVNKESVEVEESAVGIAAGVASLLGGAVAAEKIMKKLEDGDFGDKGEKIADMLKSLGSAAAGTAQSRGFEEGVEESAPGYTHDCAAHVMHESHGYGLCLEGRHTLVETTDGNAEVTHYDVMFKSGNIVEKIPVNELKVLTSEAHTHPKYEEDDNDAMKEEEVKEETGRMKVSELKAKIREDILSVLSEQEEDVDVDVDVDDEVEADVDVDVQDTVSVDAEGDDIEIEKKAVKAKVQVGLSPEEEIVQDSLKAAMDAANALGNEKLADQIGNTITFFTREYVVGGNTD